MLDIGQEMKIEKELSSRLKDVKLSNQAIVLLADLIKEFIGKNAEGKVGCEADMDFWEAIFYVIKYLIGAADLEYLEYFPDLRDYFLHQELEVRKTIDASEYNLSNN